MYKKRFGKNLRMLLEIRGITHEQAAEMFGVSSVMVHKYCSGKNFPETELFFKISDILGVSTDALGGKKKLVIIEEEEGAETVPVKKNIA